MDRTANIAPVRHFRRKLARDLRVERVILFGSRARGDARPESDWDVIVVSPDFSGIDFLDRMRRLYRYWDYRHHAIEPFPYTPDEFIKKAQEISIIREAVREGIEVK